MIPLSSSKTNATHLPRRSIASILAPRLFLNVIGRAILEQERVEHLERAESPTLQFRAQTPRHRFDLG